MRMGRLVRPTLAGVLVLMALAPFSASSAPVGDDLASCSEEGAVNVRKDGWAEINTPTYADGEGADTIVASAIPQRREWVYVTNGTVLRLSTDAGCKWKHSYRPPLGPDGTGAPSLGSRVMTLLTAPTQTSIWVAGYDTEGDLPRPHVSMTPDATPAAGNTTTAPFESFDLGLPAVGRPVGLFASGRDREALVLIEEPRTDGGSLDNPVRRLYRTTKPLAEQNIQTVAWERLTLPAELGTIAGVRSAAGDGHLLWIWSGDKYARSMDRGTTWTAVQTAPGEITEVDVDSRRHAMLYMKLSDGPALLPVTEFGVPQTTIPIPIEAKKAVHGSRGGVRAISGKQGTYGFDVEARKWAALGPRNAKQFDELWMGVGSGGRILLGQTPEKLYRFDLWSGERFIAPPRGVIGPGWDDELPSSRFTKPVLQMPRPEVTVRPGEIAEVPAEFVMGPGPAPIDVFFLLDTTMSMATAINDLKANITSLARQLETRTRGQACFGLGEFKDFSVQASDTGASNAYRLHQKISCDNGASRIEAALVNVKESGGSGPTAEAATLALKTAVTGDAHPNPVILPGQDAGFMSPTRVIVLISDAGFMEGPTFDQGTYPTIPQAIDALDAYHTHVVSVLVINNNPENEAYEDMAEVSRGTNTLAPPGGIDCDRDRNIDLVEGDPLVCKTSGSEPNLAPPIVSLLVAVKDPATMAVDINDRHDIVATVDGKPKVIDNPRVQKTVNRRVENHLPIRLGVTCRAEQDGMDLPIGVIGSMKGTKRVQGEIIVHCRAPAIPVVKPPVVLPPEPVVPEPPPPPPPPRPPVAIAAIPLFQPPPPQPISNVNPNAGFSQQEEQQFQLAPVSQGAEEEVDEATEEIDLAMSAVEREDAAAQVVLGCAMAMSVAAGAAVAYRRRTQRSVRPSYVRAR